MTDPVFHKTEQGQDEIRTRARRLDHKTRALLLIVNGERRRSDLLAQTGGMGVGPEALEALLEAGLIGTGDAAPPDAPARDAQDLPEPATTGASGPAGHADSVFSIYASRGAGDGGDAGDSKGTGSYQALYHFYTDVIGHHLGLRGYMLQVKVEKAASPAELMALRDTLYAALRKAKGEITAAAIIDQLDKMTRDEGQAQAHA
ncbi:hypothetical protein AB4Z48_08940 [Cupriavidus sp. 2TAF22]|uniref:hypothetical protein n=1 Tax=unclassified Cupriavidus TaxID=2640874 RepID=UPI003F8F170E